MERARAAQRARERIAEKDAENFWKQQRQEQGYAVSQFFGRASAQERDADVLREMRLSALRDRIRVIPGDELDRDVNRQ